MTEDDEKRDQIKQRIAFLTIKRDEARAVLSEAQIELNEAILDELAFEAALERRSEQQ